MTDQELLVSYQKLINKISEGGKTPDTTEKMRRLGYKVSAMIDALAGTSDYFKRQRIQFESRLDAMCALRELIQQITGESDGEE